MESKRAIKKAITRIWDSLPEKFGAITLCVVVQKELRKEKRFALQTTILRRLRELREAGICVYRYDKAESVYRKAA